MNNGRDCSHGRQVGKCDTCDLIKAELEIEQLKSQLVPVQQGVSGVSFTKTGVAPCANFCEAVATRKMFNQLQDKNVQLEREKVELAAQVEAFRDGLNQAIELLVTNLIEQQKSTESEIYDLRQLELLTPTQCLNQIKAEAGRDGFLSCLDYVGLACVETGLYQKKDYEAADQYAASIAKGEV